MKTIKLSAALALALTAALLAADASSASSIVFTKGGNVWRSADGSTVYADPTFSPRGNAIAFAQDAPGKRADGLYVWSFGNCSGSAKLIARGAVDPDWGPR
jgi:hypothetical protein